MALRFDDVLLAAFMGGFNYAEKESGYYEELETSEIAKGFREWRAELAEGVGTEEAPVSRPEYPVGDEPAQDQGRSASDAGSTATCCTGARINLPWHNTHCENFTGGPGEDPEKSSKEEA